MRKFLTFFYAMMFGVIALGMTACDDDDESYDPDMPESGTWSITEYDNLSMRLCNGSVGRDYWAFWENEFNKEIARRKIKINKNTPEDDGWYILSTDDERDNIGYLNDLEKIQVLSVEGNTMTADYYLKQYLSAMSDDDYVIFRATVTLTRE